MSNEKRPPHAATVQRKVVEHAATVQAKRVEPHPATVQRKTSPPVTMPTSAWRTANGMAPHPAKIVQPKSPPTNTTPPPTQPNPNNEENAMIAGGATSEELIIQPSLVGKGGGGGGKKPGGGSCPWCHQVGCVRGSKCQMHGMFGRKLDPHRGGKHKITKKLSKRKLRESEHMLPMQVVKRLFPGARMDDEPAHSISYKMHRAGQSGAGGGISSTGSSHTAKGWANFLVNEAQQHGYAAALRLVAIDTYNSAMLNNEDLDQVLVQIHQVLQGHVDLGRITLDELGDIMNLLFNRRLNSK